MGMPLGENPVPERWYSMNQCAGSFVNSLQYRVTEAGQNLLFVSYGYPAEMEFEFIDLDNDGDLRDQIRIMPERYEEDGEPTFNPSRSTVSLELRRYGYLNNVTYGSGFKLSHNSWWGVHSTPPTTNCVTT
ncbi:MAG: hypothetical protein R3E96_12360 [Planctomycetota bacterium]